MKPLILLSGGLDSAVCLWMMHSRIPVTLTVDYGQPHIREIYAAARLAESRNTENIRITLDSVYRAGGGPFGQDDTSPADTVVPVRNLLMIVAAAAVAEQRGLDTVVVGSNADDFADYPDCRPKFFTAVESCLAASGSSVKVMAPLLRMSKTGVVAKARELGVPIEKTISCYRGTTCGECAACKLRQEALA